MATTMKLIAKKVLGGNAASISLSSIPGTYTDLMLLLSLRSARTTETFDPLSMAINGSTGSASGRGIQVDEAGVSSFTQINNADMARIPTATSTSNFSNIEVYFPNYSGSQNKSYSITCVEDNSRKFIWIQAGLWTSSSAITSLSFSAGSGSNLTTNSSVYLYGITKA